MRPKLLNFSVHVSGFTHGTDVSVQSPCGREVLRLFSPQAPESRREVRAVSQSIKKRLSLIYINVTFPECKEYLCTRLCDLRARVLK